MSKKITIDGIDYVPVKTGPESGRFIYALERGWVVVGIPTQSDGQITLASASVVRRWGTSKGLGELAAKGALTGTKMDPAPEGIQFPASSVVVSFPCGW